MSLGAALVQAQPAPRIHQAAPAVAGNRAPSDLVFSPDGALAYVTETAEGTLAVIDTAAGKVVDRISTGGKRPVGLALAPGGLLLVTNTYSNSVGLIDTQAGKLLRTLSVPGMPWGVAVDAEGKRAFVTASQLDEVVVLDLPSGEVRGRVGVGRRPQAVELSADGTALAVANMAGGSLSVVNPDSLKEEARVRLKGVNVRGLSLTGDGGEAYVTLMPAFNAKPTSDPAEMWHNLVQAVRLQGESSAPAEDQWMDFARAPGSVEVYGSPDQYDIVLDASARFAWMAVGGRDVLTRITIHDRRRDAIWPISQVEAPVGANPRGLAMTPDGKQVWVSNHLGNNLTVVDAASMKVLRTIDLGPASKVDPSIRGQYLFHNAGMTRTLRFSCASCHPDGSSDGLAWNFVHVPDRFPRRNSRDLRNGTAATAPFRWSGHEKHLAGFVEDEVTGLLGGAKPSAADTEALIAAIRAMELPPSPFRTGDGKLTESAERGRALFDGKAGCTTCHAGPNAGGTGLSAWIGTTPAGMKVDVPQLRGVYDGAPYLHDGRAASLEDVFSRFNAERLHGKADLLGEAERADLLRYLRELD